MEYLFLLKGFQIIRRCKMKIHIFLFSPHSSPVNFQTVVMRYFLILSFLNPGIFYDWWWQMTLETPQGSPNPGLPCWISAFVDCKCAIFMQMRGHVSGLHVGKEDSSLVRFQIDIIHRQNKCGRVIHIWLLSNSFILMYKKNQYG